MVRLFYLGYFFVGVSSTLNGITLPFLIDKFSLNLSQARMLLSLSALAYLLASLAFPFIQRRLPVKKLLSVAFITVILAYGLFPWFSSWRIMLLLGFLANLGTGTMGVGYNTLTASFSSDGDSSAINWLHFSFGVGALLAPIILSRLLGLGFSWAIFYVITSLLALSLLILWIIKYQERPSNIKENSQTDSQENIFRVPVYWFLLISLFLYVTAEMALAGWLPTLFTTLNVNPAQASLSVSLLWIGVTVGRAICARIGNVLTPKRLLLILTGGGFITAVALPYVKPIIKSGKIRPNIVHI